MAYLADETGVVKKRVLIRKGFWEDHFDELSAIRRGENTRDIMHPVTGWARKRRAQDLEVPNPGTPKSRTGRKPIPLDLDALRVLWDSDAPAWAIARAFGVSTSMLAVRARREGFPPRRKGAIIKVARRHGGR